MPNIKSKKNKSHSTINNIINMLEGLQTYTFESGIVYLESILRSSILYGAETYYNLTESNLRMIESIEEKCLKKILGTQSKCPIYLLYLELAFIPGRFHIQKMVMNFLHYLLNQHEDSLLFKYFKTQCENPTKNDWVSNARNV